MTLAELLSQLQVKQRRVRAIFDEAGPDMDVSKITSLTGTPDEKTAAWKAAIQEVDALGKEVAERQQLEAAAKATSARETWLNTPAGQVRHAQGGGEAKGRDLATILTESEGLKRFKANGYRGTAVIADLSPVEAKTLMTLTTLAPVPIRLPGIHPAALEARTVRDLFLQGTIGVPSFTYLVETTFTNSAAEVTEGNLKPESALAFTETTENVAVIATFIPATRQILDDLQYMQSYIEGRLRFMVQRREESELLTGNGTPPNLKGVLNRSGLQTYALSGSDNNMDAIYKGIVKVRNTAFAEPTAIVMHPNNMQTIILTKSSTGDYLYGNPTDPNVGKMLWGLEVRQTTAMTANTALVGAFQPDGQVFEREGLTVTISTEHSDFFIRNQIAILAEERLGLAIYRPASFCTVTSLA